MGAAEVTAWLQQMTATISGVLVTGVGAALMIPFLWGMVLVGWFGRNAKKRTEGMTGAAWAAAAGACLLAYQTIWPALRSLFSIAP